VEGLQDDARQAQQRLGAVEAALLAVWRQLLPEGVRTYLHDRGVTTLDLTVLNPILQRAGQVAIAYQPATTSSRLVTCKVGEASFEAAARFWLEAYEPPPRPNKHVVNPADYR
jgi:hypothetical protein